MREEKPKVGFKAKMGRWGRVPITSFNLRRGSECTSYLIGTNIPSKRKVSR